MGIKFPTPWKTLIIKFTPPRDGKGVKCPGYARGGMLKLRFDRYITRLRTLLKRGTGKLKMGTKPNLNPSPFSNFLSYSLFGPHFSCFLSLCSFPIPFSPFPTSGSPFPRHVIPIPCSLFPVRCSPFPVLCFRSPFPVPRLITSHGTYNTFFFSAVAPYQLAAL